MIGPLTLRTLAAMRDAERALNVPYTQFRVRPHNDDPKLWVASLYSPGADDELETGVGNTVEAACQHLEECLILTDHAKTIG